MVNPFASRLTDQRTFLAANGKEAAVPAPAEEPRAFAPLMAGAAVGLVGLFGGTQARLRRRFRRKIL
jgi:hypothetical protein